MFSIISQSKTMYMIYNGNPTENDLINISKYGIMLYYGSDNKVCQKGTNLVNQIEKISIFIPPSSINEIILGYGHNAFKFYQDLDRISIHGYKIMSNY